MKAFFQSLRAQFATATLSGVLLGTATAYFVTKHLDSLAFLAVIVVVVSGHVSANLFNDYFDHKSGADDNNKNITPLSGGSRVIQDGGLKAFSVFLIACAFLSVSIIVGGWFVWMRQDVNLLYFGATGLFLGFAYTAPPFKFVYRGFGELIIVLTFGLFVVGGAYFAQTGNITLSAVFVLLPAGFLTANILLVNTFPDCSADEVAQKRTFVVRFGKENGKRFAKNLVFDSYFCIIAGVLFGLLPSFALISLVSLPIAFAFWLKLEKIEEDYLPVGILAIALQISFTLFTALGITLQTFV